jgi:hypothetical protein
MYTAVQANPLTIVRKRIMLLLGSATTATLSHLPPNN